MIISSNKHHPRNQSSKDKKFKTLIYTHSKVVSAYCIFFITHSQNSQSRAKTIRRTMQVPKNYSSNLYLEETKESHIKGNNFLHTDSHHQGPQRKCPIK